MIKIRYLKPAILGETLSDATPSAPAASAQVVELHPAKPARTAPRSGNGARVSRHAHAAQTGK